MEEDGKRATERRCGWGGIVSPRLQQKSRSRGRHMSKQAECLRRAQASASERFPGVNRASPDRQRSNTLNARRQLPLPACSHANPQRLGVADPCCVIYGSTRPTHATAGTEVSQSTPRHSTSSLPFRQYVTGRPCTGNKEVRGTACALTLPETILTPYKEAFDPCSAFASLILIYLVMPNPTRVTAATCFTRHEPLQSDDLRPSDKESRRSRY